MSDSKKNPPKKKAGPGPAKKDPKKGTGGRKPPLRVEAPDERRITKTQAARLSALTSISVDKIAGRTTVELLEDFEWQIDPLYLTHRRVCGRVVQEDPATGELWGVPNATVHVEDTDCSYLSYFPIGGSLGWLYPYNCHREVVATATTDECGEFCVWIPRWDIDWVLRWRHERLCFPELVPPRICDVLKIDPEIFEVPELRPRIPLPDPPPFAIDVDRVREIAGDRVAERVQLGLVEREFGASIGDLEVALQGPTLPLPPPGIPSALRGKVSDVVARMDSKIDPLPIDIDVLEQVDFDLWVGPFLRCHDIFYPEWSTIIDMPDITFRVTQEVGGVETEVYSEGHLQVRWNDTDSSDVEIRTNGGALATPLCDGPDIDPGACSEPTIVTAGLMPLGVDTATGYHDHATGYALRPNKPRPGGFATSPQSSPANAPYLGTLQLHGCHRFANAQFYRLVHSFEGGPEIPFVGYVWYTPRLDGTGNDLVSADSDGWYPILEENDYVFPHWLFNWPTGTAGRYDVKLEIADGSKTKIDESAVIPFEIDNSQPIATFDSLGWREAGSTAAPTPLDLNCPVIRRPSTMSIEIVVDYTASATHFRDVVVAASDCDGLPLAQSLGTTAADFAHWHEHDGDNLWSRTARYTVPAGSVEGPYRVSLHSRGRGFNPAGSGAGPGLDWHYDRAFAHVDPSRSICIIDS